MKIKILCKVLWIILSFYSLIFAITFYIITVGWQNYAKTDRFGLDDSESTLKNPFIVKCEVAPSSWYGVADDTVSG